MTALSGTPPEPSWVIPDFLAAGSVVCLAGDPGIGKSFLSYHIAMCLAAGVPFLGTPLAPHPVVIFDEENSPQDSTAYLYRNWVGLDRPNVAMLAQNLRIEQFSLGGTSSQVYDGMSVIVAAHKPALIVIDTATPVCRIQDENSNGEASQAIRGLRNVRTTAGPQSSMLILKHARIDKDTGQRSIRGAKAWAGESDGIIYHMGYAGRPKKDGLRPTHLEPAKTRAYGLQDTLHLIATWTDETHTGVCLSRNPNP